ncbi:EF-hand domain-containing protein [Sphingomonas sp.]|uniref:EF-hand domain-containing protein n=1 Tax=Sphingomonas sp. TaxID=28214 RepID=UPI001B165DE1|nr:EF-hand domain-containing protein [Sphingomonas sp.]MBO9714465.1 EF-hand domain-containing protein [Sphingomonas sp.]
MRPLLLLAGLLVATPAFAQSGHRLPRGDAPPQDARSQQPAATIIAEPVAMMIAAFDSDGDARVTRAEFDAGLRHAWAGVGGGSAGYIGYSDWAATWLGDRNALPSPFELDTNGDNRITFDELAARFDLYFTRFDANKDGVITRSELIQIRAPGMGPGDRRGGGMRRRGGWGGSQGGGGMGPGE